MKNKEDFNTKLERTFEDCYDQIVDLIKKKRKKWILNDLGHMSYEDVSQKVLIQVFEKWHLYDQSKELQPWLNKVIDNRMQNIYRDEYGMYARPCIGCVHNQGDELCSFTPSNRQCGECVNYKKWQVEKQRGFEIKLPEVYDENIHDSIDDSNIQNYNVNKIHDQIINLLNGSDKKLYKLIFIENQKPKQVSKAMNYKQSESSANAYIKKHENRLRKLIMDFYNSGKIDLH